MNVLRSSKSIRQYLRCGAVIERSPSSAHFLLYQEDENVLGDSEDLRGTALHYTQQLATAHGSSNGG